MNRILLAILLLLSSTLPAHAEVRYETLADGLGFPWSLAFLPDGTLLVTEREGRLRRIDRGGRLSDPLDGVPEVYVAGQGGLFDVVADADFERNQTVYLSYAHGDAGANATRVARARLLGDALVDLEVLFTASPWKETPHHYGGRLLQLPDGTLLVTIGDGYNMREHAQRLDSHLGKVIRIDRNGRPPADNPFVATPGALPEIYSFGHRNPQGLVQMPDMSVLLHEHGPRGGDEVNHLEAGENYGWPAISHGIDYTFARVTPYTTLPGMRQPILQWTPSIAPSGMTVYEGGLFPEWTGSVFVTALVERSVRRLVIKAGHVVSDEQLFSDIGERLRGISTGPDGALYLLIDSPSGRVVRVTPLGDAGNANTLR